MVRVLLADDYAPTREVIRLFLTRFGEFIVVGEAADGQEAVRLAGTLQPDVIVMDVAMPVMNGLVAARLVTEANRRIRVITLTGQVDPNVSKRALAAGACRHLSKPFDLWALARVIKEVAGGTLPVPPQPVPPGYRPADAPAGAGDRPAVSLCPGLVALDGGGQGRP
ncbi:MAG TPA: response regulator transcription factor [Bacillota bacterium]|jgi:CheY-like chemotaxis protein